MHSAFQLEWPQPTNQNCEKKIDILHHQVPTMVFFTCDGCNETLKKNQVDAHVYRCRRGCDSVSCVDCSISFYGGTFDHRGAVLCSALA